MNETETETNSSIKRLVIKHQLALFFLLTFGITWGIALVFFAFMSLFINAWGPIDVNNPYYVFYLILFVFAVFSPMISALIVISIAYGKKGLKAYFKRLLNWRFNIIGVGILISILIIGIGATFIFMAFGGDLKFITVPWYMMILIGLTRFYNDPGPVEEIGWRGFALPHLQKKYNALWSSIILGAIWAIWHLPVWFVAAMPHNQLSFPLFVIMSISLSIIMTVAYNRGSKGSIPLAFTIHWFANVMGFLFYIHSFMIFTIYTILMTCVAIVLILIFGPESLGDEKYTIAVLLNEE